MKTIGVSKMLFFSREINIFIQQEFIKLIKSDSKNFDNVTKVCQKNAFLLNFSGSWLESIMVSQKI